MKITCPTCNEIYNIQDKKIRNPGAQAACKRCGEKISIDPVGAPREDIERVVLPKDPQNVVSPDSLEEKSMGENPLFVEYPELRYISSDKVALSEILFQDKKGRYRNGKNKFKVKILSAVSAVLDKILKDGERVMRIGKGTAIYPAEIFFGNGWLTMLYNHYAILATNQRLLFININSGMKHTTHYLFQMLYEDIKKVRKGAMFGSLVFHRIKSKKRTFNGMKRFSAKELNEFIQQQTSLGKGCDQEVHENICPSCFVPLSKGLTLCPSCSAPFKTPKKASLRSLLLPGLGDIYLGHRVLGAMELVGAVMIWACALAMLLTGEPGVWIGGLLLLIFYNGIDALLTLFMAKKGYMLA